MPVYDLDPPEPRYFLGLDLGQAADYSAIAIIERHGAPVSAAFHVRHLQRWQLGTSYPAIVGDVAQMLRRSPLAHAGGKEPVLAVDQTGVGAPVVDMFRRERMQAKLQPIVITGGDSVTRENGLTRVPKRDLVSAAQVALQSERLKIAEELPEAQTLVRELENFQVKINLDTAHDSYGAWREGTHDDLVLAVALALWVGLRPDPPRIPCSAGYKPLKY
jgi:hypothetical protein